MPRMCPLNGVFMHGGRPTGAKRMPVGVRWPVEATALSKGLDATSRPWRD